MLITSGLFAAACSSSDEPAIVASPPAAGGSLDAGSSDDAGATVDAGEGGITITTPPLDLSEVGDKKWAWFEIPGAVCRDGSAAGIGLNLNPGATKMMIFLQGGGACFNRLTCGTNPAKVDEKSKSDGIFDRKKMENPVAEWNHVFVPYCTGDVHAGNNPDGNIPDVGAQKFVGYKNMGLFLEKLAATFPDTTQILLTGTSAGGYGAAANYGQAVRHFPNIRVNLVDDSGPLMRQPPLEQCLQEKWKTLWNLDTTIIAECGADCTNQDDFLMAASKHWASAKATYAQGLISATHDLTIRTFLGFGCDLVPRPLGPDKFADGLTDIRTQSAAYTNFGTYTYDATSHTILGDDEFYTAPPDGTTGTTIAAWVKDIVDSNNVRNVGP